MKHKTEQEKFWAGKFGADYIERNKNDQLLASNIAYFSRALKQTDKINSVIEFGANIGMNLRAIKLLYPNIKAYGIEINTDAAHVLGGHIGSKNVFTGSIFDYKIQNTYDLALKKGVLIHINPEKLNIVYDTIYRSSNRYIMVCEYYNPSPVMVPYRGHEDRLFKRDFAGEFMSRYPELALIDYGFLYHKDNNYPQDDLTWFLLEKRN